jgi:hypothetical protein
MGAALDDAKVGRQFDTWLRNEMKDAVPCEWVTNLEPTPCQVEAAWRLQMPCCGFPVNLCGPHREKWVTTAGRMREPYCSECGAKPVDLSAVKWTGI